MKSTFSALALGLAALLTCTASHGDLVMSGVLDGPLTGGSPKAVEFYATSDIPDLSVYALTIASNGAASFTGITSDYVLPSISLSAGEYFYAVGNSFDDMTGDFDTVFPGTTRALNFGANSNGDDVLGLFYDPTGSFSGGESLADVFGVLGTDGTGESWEHLDSWAYRVDDTTADGTFNESNWTIASPNSLDGLSASQVAAAVPFGTFTVSAIPEPTAALFGSLLAGAFGLTIARRPADRD